MRGITVSFLLLLAGAIMAVQGGFHLVARDTTVRYALIETSLGVILLGVGGLFRLRERRAHPKG